MGNRDNTKLVYISGGLIIGLFVLFVMLLGSKSRHFLSSQKSSKLHAVRTAEGHTYIQGDAPKASWKAIQLPSQQKELSARAYDSGYKPGSTYANNYVKPQDVNYPLIASAKFLKKKDKLKAKKKKASTLSKGKSRFGGSEDEDEGLSPLSSSSTAPISMASALNNASALAKKKAAQEEENINSVEFWVEPIFVQEDPQAVNKLVDSFRLRKVSTNVFYTVVTQMNSDTRANIREMGINALAVSPSTESFSQLTWAKHNDIEAQLRTEAGQHVATYTDVSKLGYVVSALNTSEASPTVTVEALKTITASTQKYSDLHALDNGAPSASAADLSALEPRYNKALELIEQNNLSNSSNTTLKTEATKTVTAINKFMTI